MTTLEQLADIEAIRVAKARYCDIVDHLPHTREVGVEQLTTLFMPEAQLDFTSLFGRVLEGHAGIREFFGGLASSRAGIWHLVSNPIVVVSGDTAKAQWLWHAMARGSDAQTAEPLVRYGRYYDEHVRTPDGWKQSSMLVVNETYQRQQPAAT